MLEHGCFESAQPCSKFSCFAVDVLETLNNGTKGTTGTYFRVGVIEGPIFSSTENPPMFMSTIDTSFVATVLS